jgi:hypothetical protein
VAIEVHVAGRDGARPGANGDLAAVGETALPVPQEDGDEVGLPMRERHVEYGILVEVRSDDAHRTCGSRMGDGLEPTIARCQHQHHSGIRGRRSDIEHAIPVEVSDGEIEGWPGAEDGGAAEPAGSVAVAQPGAVVHLV